MEIQSDWREKSDWSFSSIPRGLEVTVKVEVRTLGASFFALEFWDDDSGVLWNQNPQRVRPQYGLRLSFRAWDFHARKKWSKYTRSNKYETFTTLRPMGTHGTGWVIFLWGFHVNSSSPMDGLGFS